MYHPNLVGHPVYLCAASGSPRRSIACHYPYLEWTIQSLPPTDGGVGNIIVISGQQHYSFFEISLLTNIH